jgi:hypothetical protein
MMRRALPLVQLVLVWLALTAAGCLPTGRQFVRPTPATFRLGESTVEDVKRVLGEPADQRSWSRNSNVLADPPTPLPTLFGPASVTGTIREMRYAYAFRLGEATRYGVQPSRSLNVWFWNDRLIGYRATSSFKEDSTDFDESKVHDVTAWKTLRGEVVALMGPPSGVAGYPLTRHEDQQILIYEGFEWDTSKNESRFKTLHVLVNALGVVEDVRFDASSRPLPPPVVTPGVTTIPVYIPQRRGR